MHAGRQKPSRVGVAQVVEPRGLRELRPLEGGVEVAGDERCVDPRAGPLRSRRRAPRRGRSLRRARAPPRTGAPCAPAAHGRAPPEGGSRAGTPQSSGLSVQGAGVTGPRIAASIWHTASSNCALPKGILGDHLTDGQEIDSWRRVPDLSIE